MLKFINNKKKAYISFLTSYVRCIPLNGSDGSDAGVALIDVFAGNKLTEDALGCVAVLRVTCLPELAERAADEEKMKFIY